MTRGKTLLILVFLIILTGLIPVNGPVHGQTQIQFNRVDVSLLPEFNLPSVLVITEIQLGTETPLPDELNLQIPADSEILTISNLEADGHFSTLHIEEEVSGDWKNVIFSPTTATIRIEYYDPNLVRQGDQRAYEYRWLSSYPAESFSLSFRRPSGASDIISDPPMEKSLDDIAEYEFYAIDAGPIPAGEEFAVSISYLKSSGSPAYPPLEVEPAVPVNEATPGRAPSPMSVVMWLLTVAVAVLIMLVIYYGWFKANVINKNDRMVQGVGIMNPEKQVVFCHECGKRSRPGDAYCSNCGTELRKPTQVNRPPEF